MSSWTMRPCCGRMIGVRKDGAFRVHVRKGYECPGPNRTITQILRPTAADELHPVGEQATTPEDAS